MTRASFDRPFKTRFFRDAARAAALVTVVALALAAPAAAQPATFRVLPPANDAGPVTPVAVLGDDTRQPLQPEQTPLLEKIGTLSAGGANFCSAFCVADDVIVTAGHCLFGTAETTGPELERVEFHAGAGAQRRSSRLAGQGRRAIRSAIAAGTRSLNLSPPIDAANDWAIARLANPICTSGGLALSTFGQDDISAHAEAGLIYQVAMHRDLSANVLHYGAPCGIETAFPEASARTIAQDFANADAILMHTCDTGAGSSGSPLLVNGENGPEVVGLNVGTYVLSRARPSSSTNREAAKSDAIANTAIEAARFRAAVEAMTFATSALPVRALRWRGRNP